MVVSSPYNWPMCLSEPPDEGGGGAYPWANCRHHTVRRSLFASAYNIQAQLCTSRYQAQVRLLSSILRPKYGAELEIGSVDGMQGREKEAVIISLVRSNETVCTLLDKVTAILMEPLNREKSVS